jgi:hypothetical protein
MPTKAIWMLAGVIAFLAGVNVELGSQTKPKVIDGPFRIVAKQDEPPVTLFEHRGSGVCFLGWGPGGIIQVDSEMCKRTESGWARLLPILPFLPAFIPGPPISPER